MFQEFVVFGVNRKKLLILIVLKNKKENQLKVQIAEGKKVFVERKQRKTKKLLETENSSEKQNQHFSTTKKYAEY